MLLATLQTLEKELKDYTKRVEFLDSFIEKINNNTYESELDEFEWLNTSYKLEKERDFKNNLIKQREIQIKQAKEQEELKKSCIKEFPEVLENAKSAMMTIVGDLEGLAKKKKRTKEENDTLKALKHEIDQNTTIINGCIARFENNNEHSHIINDFRQLHEIIKLAK